VYELYGLLTSPLAPLSLRRGDIAPANGVRFFRRIDQQGVYPAEGGRLGEEAGGGTHPIPTQGRDFPSLLKGGASRSERGEL